MMLVVMFVKGRYTVVRVDFHARQPSQSPSHNSQNDLYARSLCFGPVPALFRDHYCVCLSSQRKITML